MFGTIVSDRCPRNNPTDSHGKSGLGGKAGGLRFGASAVTVNLSPTATANRESAPKSLFLYFAQRRFFSEICAQNIFEIVLVGDASAS